MRIGGFRRLEDWKIRKLGRLGFVSACWFRANRIIVKILVKIVSDIRMAGPGLRE